ncbi:MAG: hypothetical protein GY863_01390 [bacterium]|nr:hypothetical protein [bacterium]
MRVLFTITILIVFLIPSSVSAQKLGVLPDLDSPASLHADSSRFYVTEQDKIYIYTKDNLELIRKFGKAGNNEGEFRIPAGSGWSIRVDIQSENIIVTSEGVMSIFNKKGEFIKEVLIHPQADMIAPFKDRFVSAAYYIIIGTGKSEEYFVIHVNGLKDITRIREFYRSGLGQGSAMGLGDDGDFDVQLFPIPVRVQIFGDKIVLGDAAKGMYFAVYDYEGKLLHEIDEDYVKIPVSETIRNAAITKFKERKTYERFKDIIEFEIPEFLPAFKRFIVSGDNIYVYSYPQNDSVQELIVLDISGNELNRYTVPVSKCSTIRDNNYYYLRMNKYNEWEILVEDLSKLQSEANEK